MSSFPSPRHPTFPKPSAEKVRKKLDTLFDPPADPRLRFFPDYGVKKGDKILLVTLSENDPLVMDTFCELLKERGARVDMLRIDSRPVASPNELASHEPISMDHEEEDYNYYYTVMCDFIRPATARAMIERDKYTKIISGAAGPIPKVPIPWHRFGFPILEDYVDGGVFDFPQELFMAITNVTWTQILSCHSLRITDPEGTDVAYTNYDDKRDFFPGHLFVKPLRLGHGFGGKDDCNGVVAGTMNHMGAYPHIQATIENGLVVKLEGGGNYGEAWRQKLEEYRDCMIPPLHVRPRDGSKSWDFEMPGKGLFWFTECGLGGEPKVFRLPREGLFECYANFLHDRRRSGFIHNGFGPPMGQTKPGLPWTHVHIHCMFPTLSGKTAKGETVIIVDKGHLTALDDPQVRELAGRFGNADDLLKETWFPAIPGINAPGDYMKDYGHDPMSWIMKEARQYPVWKD